MPHLLSQALTSMYLTGALLAPPSGTDKPNIACVPYIGCETALDVAHTNMSVDHTELERLQSQIDRLASRGWTVAEADRLDAEEQAAAEEKARQESAEPQNEPQEVVSEPQSGSSLGTFQITGYGADCVGCSGITATGVDVRGGVTHYQGYRVIAADWSVLPPYSIVNIEGVGECIVLDSGGAIKGAIIDLLFPSEADTIAWGRQLRNVSVIQYGGGGY